MKKITLILIFLSFNAFSQKHILKTNPVGDIFKIYNLGYELKVTEKSSAQITIYDHNFSNYSGYAISGEYRMYFKEALKGWFWGPNLTFLKVKDVTENLNNENYNLYGVNAEIGRQWFISKKITFDFLIGAGYGVYHNTIENDKEGSLAGILSFSFGYSFE